MSEYSPEFTRLCSVIGETTDPAMAYHSSFAREGDTKELLAGALERQRPHDIRRGLTHAGPHRDDLQLTLSGRDLRVFGSAGQQRTAAIALRMLEAATLRATTRLEPMLLLDDPFAELDVKRSERILGLLENAGLGQTVLVVPRAADIPPELVSLERMHIHAGQITKSAA